MLTNQSEGITSQIILFWNLSFSQLSKTDPTTRYNVIFNDSGAIAMKIDKIANIWHYGFTFIAWNMSSIPLLLPYHLTSELLRPVDRRGHSTKMTISHCCLKLVTIVSFGALWIADNQQLLNLLSYWIASTRRHFISLSINGHYRVICWAVVIGRKNFPL